MARIENLTIFTQWCATACQEAPGPEDDGPNALVMTDDDADGLLCLGIPVGCNPKATMRTVRAMMVGEHDFAGMATSVRWSPDQITDFFDAWCLVTVQRDMLARVSIIRIGSRECYDVPVDDAPWFALSTAGSCRGWLDGVFTELKQIPKGDTRLFGKPLSGDPVPPTDKFGRI